MSWAAAELARADLGDVRRNRRLVRIVEDLAASPESSVPLASRDRAALQGMYDFWANPRIRAEDIFAAHRASTIDRIEGYPIVLAIQDTTELDYSHHPDTQGLGYLRGENTKGMLLRARVEREQQWCAVWAARPTALGTNRAAIPYRERFAIKIKITLNCPEGERAVARELEAHRSRRP